MAELRTRRMQPEDRPGVDSLLDATLGRGFWDPSGDLDDIVLVAVEREQLIGVASASVEMEPSGESGTAIGHVRLVAVAPIARGRGVATRLVSEVSQSCETRGATRLVAYAWVHGRGGIAPLSGSLERAGYARERRIEGFYAGTVADPCPACGKSPCECPADLYRRDVVGVRG